MIIGEFWVECRHQQSTQDTDHTSQMLETYMIRKDIVTCCARYISAVGVNTEFSPERI